MRVGWNAEHPPPIPKQPVQQQGEDTCSYLERLEVYGDELHVWILQLEAWNKRDAEESPEVRADTQKPPKPVVAAVK